MDVQRYLKRIGMERVERLDEQMLQKLQRQHLLHIPFENLDIHLGKTIFLNYTTIYDKVVSQRRGGFCYELNGLFYLLLEELGFDVKRIAARVLGSSGILGPEFDHMAVIARIENTDWLVDVGFGKFSFLPLKIQIDELQSDGMDSYKIAVYDDQHLAVYSNEEEEWRLGYIFSTQHQETIAFESMCHYQQTSPDTNFTKRRMITMPDSKGRITLTDSKLKITRPEGITENQVDSEEAFCALLKEYFGMDYRY